MLNTPDGLATPPPPRRDTPGGPVRAETEDDAAVIRQSQSEPAAFASIYDRHARTIHRYLARRVGPHDADDLVAEVFIRAFQHRDRFTAAGSAMPWLYGIATNLVRDRHRGETRWLKVLGRLTSAYRDEDFPDDDIVERVDADKGLSPVARAVAGLKQTERDILLLHAWGGLTYEEIAAALDLPIGSVRSKLFRTRTRLRKQIPTSLLEGLTP